MQQHFFIKKGATLPYLVVELKPTGYNTDIIFNEKLLNSTVTFYMKEQNCDVFRIKCKPASVYEDTMCDDTCYKKYYIVYQFTELQTKKVGAYDAYFEIDFLDGCGKLIAPIAEKIIVNISN